MIINLESIYKKMIYTVIKRRYGIRLRKAELNEIKYTINIDQVPNLKKDVKYIEGVLLKSKRIKLKEYRFFYSYISRFFRQYISRN